MSNQQPPPSRPWLRLATMIRPPPPPAPPPPASTPTAPTNQGPSPPRPTIIRPALISPNPPPQQPTPRSPPPQQPILTPSPPRTTPPPVPSANVVEPLTSAPPTSPSRKSTRPSPPNTPPRPSPTATRSSIATTRAATPPSSPPKIIKPLQPTPPPLPPTNLVSPPPSPPSRSPPKKSHPISSTSRSPNRPPLIQQTERLLPPSSPPKTISPAPSTMYPGSPLVLPSLKEKPYDEGPPEYKQKTVDVQETKEIPKNSTSGFNGRHTGGVHTHNSIRKTETHKKHYDSEDAGKNIITIAGENKGAIMKITPFSDKQHDFGNSIHINKHKPTSSNNGEAEDVAKNKNQNSNELLKTSFLNSNVQGVNNSILFNCSISHHDPGIHLILSTKSDRDSGIHSKEHKKG